MDKVKNPSNLRVQLHNNLNEKYTEIPLYDGSFQL